MDCRYIKYSESINLLKDYKPFTVVTCNPYSVMPRSIYDYITEYCYIQDKEDRSCEGKVFKHVFTEINDDEFFTFNIYRVPVDFKIPKYEKIKEIVHMETKQELKQIISDLENQLKEAQEKLEKLGKYERFKPEENETYYCVNEFNEPVESYFTGICNSDKNRYRCYNCFRTLEEAEKEANKILIRRKLEDLARRLNGGEEIDWNNFTQIKYRIFYNYEKQVIDYSSDCKYKNEGAVYCLDPNFLDKAIDEIGGFTLIDYIKGE